MALRLVIISSQHQQLGPKASIVLGTTGGSIGRALDNDWALPDARRYLSSHHARFHFRQGGYFLEDTSTNGVFVNESSTPQGRHGLYELHEGDLLRMGEYRIQVHLDDDEAQHTPGASTLTELAVDHIEPLPAVGQEADDLGASLNIEALIPPGGRAHTDWASGARGSAAAADTLSAQQQLTRLRAAARARLEGNSAPAHFASSGLKSFCLGAGIDPARMPLDNEGQSLRLIGRLLRETITGLREVLRAQQTIQNAFQLEPGNPADSPLERTTDEYLQELFAGHERNQFDAVMRLRDCFKAVAEHDAAIEPALRGALAQFLAHLEPAKLESSGGPQGDGTSWNRYREIYAQLLRNQKNELPHLFAEAVTHCYNQARASGKN